MFSLRLILAAGCLSTLISGAPVPFIHSSAATQVASIHLSERSTANSYTVFGGTGDVTDGWPALSSWVSSFDTMFSNNEAVMKDSCTQWSVPANTDAEIASMKSAIQSVASSSGIDARFILAIVMQESNGCIRAPTTNYGVRNPGLMQSHNGAGTCNDGTVQNPCPDSEILQMIQDGTLGTSSGDGLKQCLSETGATDVSMYYKAARIYNSGSIDSSKNLGAGIATHCYSSDIANRLTGWFSGPSSCNPVSIMTFTGVATAAVPEAAAPAAPAASVASTPAAAAGGVFAELPSTTTTTPAAATTTVAIASAPVATEAPVTTTTPVAIPEPVVASPVVASPEPVTATVIPTPASSAAAAPAATSAPAAASPAPVTTGEGAQTAGTACTTEGMWNCINKSSFQQCASGTWSAVLSLAAGMECTSGMSMVFDAKAIV